MNLTRSDVEGIAEEAATKAVKKTLIELGIQHTDPLEMQADFLHLRHWRTVTEKAASKFILTTIGIITVGTIAAFWLGLKQAIK